MAATRASIVRCLSPTSPAYALSSICSQLFPAKLFAFQSAPFCRAAPSICPVKCGALSRRTEFSTRDVETSGRGDVAKEAGGRGVERGAKVPRSARARYNDPIIDIAIRYRIVGAPSSRRSICARIATVYFFFIRIIVRRRVTWTVCNVDRRNIKFSARRDDSSFSNIKKPPILSVSAVAKTIRLSRGIQLRPDLVPANLVYFYAIEYAPPSLSLFLSLWSQSRPEDEIKTPPRLIGFQFENN